MWQVCCLSVDFRDQLTFCYLGRVRTDGVLNWGWTIGEIDNRDWHPTGVWRLLLEIGEIWADDSHRKNLHPAPDRLRWLPQQKKVLPMFGPGDWTNFLFARQPQSHIGGVLRMDDDGANEPEPEGVRKNEATSVEGVNMVPVDFSDPKLCSLVVGTRVSRVKGRTGVIIWGFCRITLLEMLLPLGVVWGFSRWKPFGVSDFGAVWGCCKLTAQDVLPLPSSEIFAFRLPQWTPFIMAGFDICSLPIFLFRDTELEEVLTGGGRRVFPGDFTCGFLAICAPFAEQILPRSATLLGIDFERGFGEDEGAVCMTGCCLSCLQWFFGVMLEAEGPKMPEDDFSVKVDLGVGLLIFVKPDSWCKTFLQLLIGEDRFLAVVLFEEDLETGEWDSIFSDLEFVMRTHDGELVISRRTPRFLPEVGVLTGGACILVHRANPADFDP